MAWMTSEQKKARKKQHKYDEEIKLSSPSRVPVLKPSPSSMMDPVNLSLSNKQDKDEVVEMSGLTDKHYCTTHRTLASVIGSMVTNTLGYPNLENHDLVIQFSIYFESLEWKSGLHDCVSRKVPPELSWSSIGWKYCGHDQPSDTTDFGAHCSVCRDGEKAKALSQQVNHVWRASWLSCKKSSFLSVQIWRRYSGIGTYSYGIWSKITRVLDFQIRAFVDNVMRNFKGHGQLSYLEDSYFCDDQPVWSEAFSSRLLDSLADSNILGYLSTKLKDEGNCAEV